MFLAVAKTLKPLCSLRQKAAPRPPEFEQPVTRAIRRFSTEVMDTR